MISKKTAQRLLEIFGGETVIFYLKDMKISAVSDDGEQISFNGMIDGLVIDVDEHYFYLGDDNGDVEKIIGHDLIAIMEIAKYETEVLHIEYPTDEEDIH